MIEYMKIILHRRKQDGRVEPLSWEKKKKKSQLLNNHQQKRVETTKKRYSILKEEAMRQYEGSFHDIIKSHACHVGNTQTGK